MFFIEEQVLRGLVKVLDRKVQAVEYATFEGGAERILGFPYKIKRFILAFNDGTKLCISASEGIQSHSTVRTYGSVITHLTV